MSHFCVEPIGGASPKFPHGSKSSTWFINSEESISLSCPAQAFPVPAFRLVKWFFIEPIGGASPKFAHESKGSIILKDQAETISLTCPAQAYPVPAFR